MDTTMKDRKPLVLVVDDSIDDLMLVRRAVDRTALACELRTLDSGEEAIRYISGEGIYANRDLYPQPRLVILDLKMPRMSGFDVLAVFRRMGLNRPPSVVVLSSSFLPEDMEKAAALGATAFRTKPVQFKQLCGILLEIFSLFCLPESG